MSAIIQMQRADSPMRKERALRNSVFPHSALCILPSAFRGGRRRAFTLVEMLVVITIIGVLVSLASVAVFKALETAKKARIKMEITNLESAIEAFRQKYNDYPPSFVDATKKPILDELRRFIAKAFPRCTADTEIAAIPRYDGSYPTAPTSSSAPFTSNKPAMTPAQALVFWLTSVSKDVTRPFSAPASVERQSFFDFDKTRFLDAQSFQAWSPASNTVPVYQPVSGKNQPYYYFAARDYIWHVIGRGNPPPDPPTNYPGQVWPVPYLTWPTWDANSNGALDASSTGPELFTDTNGNLVLASFNALCANPKTFQIISAGLDGDFGAIPKTTTIKTAVKISSTPGYFIYWKSYPDGKGYDSNGADDDNITNFCEKNGLGDAKP